MKEIILFLPKILLATVLSILLLPVLVIYIYTIDYKKETLTYILETLLTKLSPPVKTKYAPIDIEGSLKILEKLKEK